MVEESCLFSLYSIRLYEERIQNFTSQLKDSGWFFFMCRDFVWFLKFSPNCVPCNLIISIVESWSLFVERQTDKTKQFSSPNNLSSSPFLSSWTYPLHLLWNGRGDIGLFPPIKKKTKQVVGFPIPFFKIFCGWKPALHLSWILEQERQRSKSVEISVPSRFPRRPRCRVCAPPDGEARGPQLPGSGASRSGWVCWDQHRLPGAAARPPLAPAPRRWKGPHHRRHHWACPCPPRSLRSPQAQSVPDNPPLVVSFATRPTPPSHLALAGSPHSERAQFSFSPLSPSFCGLGGPSNGRKACS